MGSNSKCEFVEAVIPIYICLFNNLPRYGLILFPHLFPTPFLTDAARKEVYFMAIIDILTHYDAKKKAAHAAKTVKHGVSRPPLQCPVKDFQGLDH